MALQEAYEKFLASPNPASLSEGASFSYVPTLTTVKDAEPIVKQLERQNKTVVKTKSQKIISVIEGDNALAADVETTLEFISGGGAWLPGLDNFVVDKIATFPATHIVAFDNAEKIKQIRISWDQGALLKQVGIIGSSGRNWPICDGKDQARLIAGASVGTVLDNTYERGRQAEQVPVASRSTSPSKKHIVDPYSSLAKTGFAPPEGDEIRIASPSPVAPRASAKPPPRDLGELFVGGNAPPPEQARPVSPSKEVYIPPPKGASSRKFQASRLFEESSLDESPANRYKPDPKKYSHFELGNGEEPELEPEKPANHSRPISMRPATNKHLSQWHFEDFTTPVKPAAKVRGQDVRHYGWSDDEGELSGSPGKHPHVAHPRRDAQTHFALQDTTPAAEKTRPVSQSGRNAHLGLYQNHIYDDADENGKPQAEIKQPLSTVTNINNRRKDFDSSWMINDDIATKDANNENMPSRHMHEPGLKNVRMTEAQSANYDQSPDANKAENQKPQAQKKHVQVERHWGFGDDEEGITEVKPKHTSAAGGGKSFWDF
ncbi:hypothetical protein UCRPC4_g02452 [Phaeomoniella chlamydospora]|uniref:Uncharacterized protein n=1 Tax=Phaeomoniella chlamydospora TaxID=158046 RepID=A0A0G2EQE0_PHACM|nr:hypothetical protein UCRPC4_g02452 [Phaeomoniella chlamydospora]